MISEFRFATKMALELVCGSDCWCNRLCRTSPVVLEGFWGQVWLKIGRKPAHKFKGLRPMPPTPSASAGCKDAECKAAGCKAAGLQAAGLQAAGLKAARVCATGCRAAGCRVAGCKGCATGCRVGQFAQRGGNAVLVNLGIQNSLRISRARVCNERNLRYFRKSNAQKGPKCCK